MRRENGCGSDIAERVRQEKAREFNGGKVLLLKVAGVAWRSSDSHRHVEAERKSSKKPE